MIPENSFDFAMERRLRQLDPMLHKRFTDTVFGLQNILSNYKLLFPAFTDHTELHSVAVIDFCNQLIGDQIDRMNADEIYTLLVSCYFHDTGMGISQTDYKAFSPKINFGNYFDTHSRKNVARIIRDFHNEYSGLFIKKYAEFFEIPSKEHLWAIVEIARGHRKTQLTDIKQYPLDYSVPGGNPICLPYLAALIRLSDEIDVTAARNPAFMYDLASFTEEKSIIEHRKHRAVKDLIVSEDAFTMLVDTKDERLMESIVELSGKMQETLDDCRQAVLGRTPYVITQERIEILRV